ncbi:MAG: rod shape-determining protein MreC [Candidatus Nanopelagicaceae bacterium]|jgi:rod shape-determining protein MreC
MAGGGNNRSRLLLVILLVTSLFLITLDLRGVSITKNSRNATQSFLAPIQRGVSDLFSPVGNLFSDIKNFGKTKAELRDLKRENAKLRKKVILNKDTAGQLKKLKSVLDLAGRGSYKVVSARVIGKGSSSTFTQSITIDAGSSDGVKKDMTVMGELGLVGVVKSTTSTSAIVLLMNDPTFRVGVRIARSQSIGVLMGEGDNNYTLQLLDPSGSIEKDDVLLTLGSDNNKPFVPGLPVGYVKSVRNTSATLTQEASVRSYSNLHSIGVVSVIVKSTNGGPKDALVPRPTPTPTTTIYVTQSPTPEASPTQSSKAKN